MWCNMYSSYAETKRNNSSRDIAGGVRRGRCYYRTNNQRDNILRLCMYNL